MLLSRFYIFLFLSAFMFYPAKKIDAQQPAVKSNDGEFLKFPWTGGLDACQFGEMDLNGDGINDLLVFDRRGNRLLCFLNDGLTGEISYTYAPQYHKYFPELFEWVVFTDYNNDGKTDIFTYSPGWAGMRVFKNISEDHIEFELTVSPYLSSFQGSGYVNIISTNADYPAIVDIDGDGDLDILTFWALGTFIELHKNQSMEKYGHADSLDYIKTDFCWGRIAENEENNILYLDTCLFNREMLETKEGFRHRGATMLVNDFTGNGLPDMLLSDVDYPGLTLLVNGGTLDNAIIVSQDTTFPSNDVQVKLFSMPFAALIDVNNDGKMDLLVSPFDPNPSVTENEKSIWLYLNTGSDALPEFRLETKEFLQNQMIDHGSGAYPILYDIFGRGKKDLIIGNVGTYIRSWYIGLTLHSEYLSRLAYYENLGDKNDLAFQLMDDDLAGLSSLKLRGLVPAIADISGNGLPDLLVGNETGKLIYAEQTTPKQWTIQSQNYLNINVGSWSSPQLFDLDEDGIPDLVIGSRNGKITFYKGFQSNDKLSFNFVTDNLGDVNVTDFALSYDGYSTPCFFYTPENEIMLLVGSEQGKLFLFDQIRGNLEGTFRERTNWESIIDTNLNHIDLGMRTAGWIGKMAESEKLQLVAGNYSGGLQLFNAEAMVAPGLIETSKKIFEVFPNPANNQVEIKLNESISTPIYIGVYDLEGRKLLSDRIELTNTTKTIDLQFLKRGVYLIKLENNNLSSSVKMVKY
jgi:hypothetical protein